MKGVFIFNYNSSSSSTSSAFLLLYLLYPYIHKPKNTPPILFPVRSFIVIVSPDKYVNNVYKTKKINPDIIEFSINFLLFA